MSNHEQMTQTALAALERRAMFRKAGASVAGALAAAVIAKTTLAPTAAEAATTAQAPTAGPTATDLAILNFALNLEYLEAQFYSNAVLGTGLTAAVLAGGDGTPGGAPVDAGTTLVPFKTPRVQKYAQVIAADEMAHVLFLKSALGASAVPAPVLDVSAAGAFSTLARAAGFVRPKAVFDPYGSENDFLLGAFIFEDVGVTAYAGAAALISQPSALVQYAASILAVEAYHAGTIRALLTMPSGRTAADEVATDAIANLRSILSSGSGEGTPQGDDYGTLDSNNHALVIAPVDANALAYRRSVGQVLNIVYGNPNAQPGLFFPCGLSVQPGVTGFS